MSKTALKMRARKSAKSRKKADPSGRKRNKSLHKTLKLKKQAGM